MKRDVYGFLAAGGWVAADMSLDACTTSMLIGMAQRNGITFEAEREAMAITSAHELAGMTDAGLEPGASELLEMLHGRYTMVIVTNNSEQAARRALERTGIADRFALVVGRESMEAMKPDASGYRRAIGLLPGVRDGEWISIGDSWIDGRASADAGVPFVSYRTDIGEMNKRGVYPAAVVDSLAEFGRLLSSVGSC